jgi:predicted Fe-Mo cluster-binding NifX family protein
VIHQERVSTERLDLPQRMEQLASSGVKKLICGGIHDFSLEELRNIGIDVFYNVIGEAQIALALCLNGELNPGSNCEKKKDGKFARRGCRERAQTVIRFRPAQSLKK